MVDTLVTNILFVLAFLANRDKNKPRIGCMVIFICLKIKKMMPSDGMIQPSKISGRNNH